MTHSLFESRAEAGRRLAARLQAVDLVRPIVLAIPRGGIEVGAPLALALGAELDVVLSRKLRAPNQPELAVGSVSESGEVYLGRFASELTGTSDDYLQREVAYQIAELERRAKWFRAVRAKADVRGRTVVITDDGIATGATMIAALRTVRAQQPKEIIVAIPVAPREQIPELRALSDRVVCLCVASEFWSVGQYYRSFAEVTDDKVEQLLRESARTPRNMPPEKAGDRTSAEQAPAVSPGPAEAAARRPWSMSAAWRPATSRLPQPPGETPRPLPIEIPVVPEPVPGLVPEVPVPPVEVPAPAPSEVPEPREHARGG